MIPGLFGSRLALQINCDNFLSNPENLKNLRFFCGESICPSKKGSEEHTIWPSLFSGPFKLNKNTETPYCLGYFFTFYNNKEDCPTWLPEGGSDPLSVCNVDPSVKIKAYGETEKTKIDGECGIRGIRNIVDSGKAYIPDLATNFGASKNFDSLYQRLEDLGYRVGFSMAGIAYDYRRFVVQNKKFQADFKYHIERLYENTGKPVVIFAHSFGNLNTLNLLVDGTDKTFLKKIKKWVAIAPPFAGAGLAVANSLYGTQDNDTKKEIFGQKLIDVQLDLYGQKLMNPFQGVLYELRPRSTFFDALKRPEYMDLYNAIQERIDLELKCGDQTCQQEIVEKYSAKFSTLFPSFPKITDNTCKLESYLKEAKFREYYNSFLTSKIKNQMPTPMPCRFNIFDVFQCPTVVYRGARKEFLPAQYEQCTCREDDTSPYNDSHIYSEVCKENDYHRCFDHFFTKNMPYPYDLSNSKIQNLVNTYRKYNLDLPKFPTIEEFYHKAKLMMDFHTKINQKLNEIPIPVVDTAIIYSSSLPVQTAFIYDSSPEVNAFNTLKDVLMKGGDGTVPTFSSLLVGLKWKFENSKRSEKIKLQMIEYCSTTSKFTGLSNEFSEDKEFMHISCKCLSKEGVYNTKSINECNHSEMLSDDELIKFFDNFIMNKETVMTEEMFAAYKRFDKNKDYHQECNNRLFELSNL
jgi:hypothetical protein